MERSAAAVTATYTLHLPPGVDHPLPLTPSAHHNFLLSSSDSPQGSDPASSGGDLNEIKTYYTKLRNAISDARAKLGEELTAWRDAVAGEEARKEKSVKIMKEEEEGESGEEEKGEEGA